MSATEQTLAAEAAAINSAADQLLTDNLAECLRAALADEDKRATFAKRASWTKSARVALTVYDARKASKAALANAPRFAVGDWAYNNMKGHNARVLAVTWDKSLHGYTGGWRYSVPGLSDPNLYAEETDKPYGQYQDMGNGSWREIGLCSREDSNLAAVGGAA